MPDSPNIGQIEAGRPTGLSRHLHRHDVRLYDDAFDGELRRCRPRQSACESSRLYGVGSPLCAKGNERVSERAIWSRFRFKMADGALVIQV